MLCKRGVDDGDVELHDAIAEAHGGERQRFFQLAWYVRFHRVRHGLRIAKPPNVRGKSSHGRPIPFLVIPIVDMGSRSDRPTRFLQRRDTKKSKFRRNFSGEWNLRRQSEKLLRVAEINLLTLGGRQRQPRRYRQIVVRQRFHLRALSLTCMSDFRGVDEPPVGHHRLSWPTISRPPIWHSPQSQRHPLVTLNLLATLPREKCKLASFRRLPRGSASSFDPAR